MLSITDELVQRRRTELGLPTLKSTGGKAADTMLTTE